MRRGLARAAIGRTVVRCSVGRDRAVRRDPDPDTFPELVTGRTIGAVTRVGKVVVLDLGPRGVADHDVVVVHLGMSGQLRTASDDSDRPAHTHVVWSLSDGTEVRFVDPRTFGHVRRSTAPPGGRPASLAHFGPDAWDLGAAELAAALAGRRVAVKTRLLDQTAVAGLGNIYADESLHRAGVSPLRAAGDLDADATERLAGAVRTVLREAVAAGGSTLGDGGYVDVDGNPGRFQGAHRVHARGGQPCPACDGTVLRVTLGGRSAAWCPRCQG